MIVQCVVVRDVEPTGCGMWYDDELRSTLCPHEMFARSLYKTGDNMARTVEFFCEGRPRPTQTGTVKRFGGRLIPVRRNPGWSQAFALCCSENRPAGGSLIGPLAVALTFFLRRPRRPPRGSEVYPAQGGRDLDNLAKGTLDAARGFLWRDDAQIVDLALAKRYANFGYPCEMPEHASQGVLVRARELVACRS